MSKIIIGLGFFCLLMGCWTGGVDFKVRFDHVQGLKKNEAVMFEKKQIGRVTDVQYQQDGFFIVTVKIKEEFEGTLTEHSRFFIGSALQEENQKTVKMIHTAEGGKALEEGVTVDGASRASALLDKMWQTLDKGIKDLESQFKEFSEQLEDLPESKAYQDLKNEIERFSREMKDAGDRAREKWEKEAAPRLKKKLEELREKLLKPQKEESPKRPLAVKNRR